MCVLKRNLICKRNGVGPNYLSNGLVVGWAYFKAHIKITFFNGGAMEAHQELFNHCKDNAFNRSIKVDAKNALNKKVLELLIQEGIKINGTGFKRSSKLDKPQSLPSELDSILNKNISIKHYFDALAPSHKKEYIEYITSAKKEETKMRRLTKVEEMLNAKRSLNDKYR